MSMSAGAAPIPTAPDPFLALLPWITEHAGTGDPVRDEAYRCGLSAIVHRVLKFGCEASLNLLTARDCLNCCLLCGSHIAEFFLRLAFTRALIEDDQAIVGRLLQTPFLPESRVWLAKLMASVQGDEKAVAEGAAWLETLSGEELAIASLVVGRIMPELRQSEWLLACPLTYPRLPAELALLLLQDKQYEPIVRQYLRDHPEVRYAVDDRRWARLSA